MIKIGDFELHLIMESLVHMDGGGPFGLVPRKLWSRFITPEDENRVPMSQNCLYVKTPDQQIVIDTGYGTKLSDKVKQMYHLEHENGLIRGLSTLGVAPEDIDLVIDTHLHGDHCGGNTYYDDNGDLQPTFPNAEYVVQKREYEDAISPNERTAATYIAENFQPLIDSGQMRLLDGDSELAPGISSIVTPGHTPGHMSVRLESQGEHAAFLCDLASFAVHFERLAWMTAYDVEPLITLETKRVWQQWAIETEAVLFFPHDTMRPVGRLRDTGGRRPELEVIEEAFVSTD